MRIVSTVRLLAVLAVLLTALWALWVASASYGAAARSAARDELAALVGDRSSSLSAILRTGQSNARFLASLDRTEEALPTAAARRACADLLVAFTEAHDEVFQARLIDAAGREVVRVDHDPGGAARRIADDDLQDKSARAYVAESLQLAPGDVYLSPIDLNREHGEITIPHRPTIRVAATVAGPTGSTAGVVVLNLDLTRVFEQLRPGAGEVDAFLTDAAGNYLLHSDPERAFAHEFGPARGLAQDRPDLLAALEGNSEPSVFAAAAGFAAALARIDTGEGSVQRTFYAGAARPLATVPHAELGIAGLAAALVALVLAVGLGSLVGVRVVAPIEEITAAAAAWERGDEEPAFPVDRAGEVGDLARTFARLRDTVESRTRALESARDDLEAFARMAAHDLREPAQRVAGFADLLAVECDDLGPDARHLVLRIIEQGEAMLGQVAAFAQLSRVHPDGEGVTSFALDEMVDALRADLGPELRERGAALRCSPATLAGHRLLLATALRNLVRNALLHSTADALDIEVGGSSERGTTLLEVHSNGAELDPATLEDIFLPFVSSGPNAGEGIGLSIVMRTAQYHGGHAAAELEGSVLRIRMLYPTPALA